MPKNKTIRRIVYQRPRQEPAPVAVKPKLQPAPITKGAIIGQTPADLTFFKSIRVALDSGGVTEAYRQHIWVYVCIKLIAQNIASVPFHIYSGTEESPVRQEEGALVDLFDNPNPQMSRYQLWEALLIYLGLDGECIFVLEKPKGKETDGTAVPSEIWPLRATRFEPVIENNFFIGWKYHNGNGKDIVLSTAQVIQFKYYNPYNIYRGMSPISACEMSIKQDWNASKYNNAFFENSADPGGILLYKGQPNQTELTDARRKEYLAMFNDRHQGQDKAYRVALLEGGFEYQPLSISHTDMMFLEQKGWNLDEICSAFGLSRGDVGKITDANFATAFIRHKALWTNNFVPKMSYIEDVLWTRLFRNIDGGKFWGAFDRSAIEALQEDLTKKIDNAYKLFQMTYPVNAINNLLKLGLPNVPWGDEAFMSFSMTPASTLLNKPAPGDAEPEPDAEPPDKLHPEPTVRLTPKQLFWKNYAEKILDPNEKEMRLTLKTYIWKLRVEQLKRFAEAVKGKAVAKTSPGEVGALLFSREEWDKRLKEKTRPIYETIMTMAGQQLGEEMDGIFQFNLTDPAMISFLEKKLIKVTSVNDSIREQLSETLMGGIAAGETTGELQERIKTVFNFASNRAHTIARTETAEASSGTRFLAMKQEKVPYHEWITANDEGVRESHQLCQKQGAIPIGYKFSNGLLYPSDINGPAGEVINCRCVAVAVHEKGE